MTESYINLTQHFTTILDFLRFGISSANAAQLAYGHGTDNAYDDIYALVYGLLGLSFDCDKQLLHGRLTDAEKYHLATQLERRITQHVPVPYLTQTAYFCGLSFYVDERVLIPRSPIAESIEQHFAPWVEASNVSRILDLCTGSGCIAIACAYAFPDAHVDAVDLSKDALAVADINCREHAMGDQVTLIESDCFDNLPKASYDIIVSNPPYVGQEEMQTLPAEYRHEPVMALEAANDGLVIVDKILAQAREYLAPDGILVVEVGNTAEALIAAYPDIMFTWIDFERGGHGVFLLTRQQMG